MKYVAQKLINKKIKMENNFNPVISAVVKLRKLALDVLNENKNIKELFNENINTLEILEQLLPNDTVIYGKFLQLKSEILANKDKLLTYLIELEVKFKNKEVKSIAEIYDGHTKYSFLLKEKLNQLQDLGNISIKDETRKIEWENYWKIIISNFKKITEIADTYKIKLSAIEKLAPSEIDELTSDILKNIPADYSEEEAFKYEQEYMEAYKEIKNIAKKKNFWDKVLDILAGGYQETPAHRVAMKKWIEGEI